MGMTRTVDHAQIMRKDRLADVSKEHCCNAIGWPAGLTSCAIHGKTVLP